MPSFNLFKRGKKALKNIFMSPCYSRSKDDIMSIPTRKSDDELEWEKCQKFIMIKPLQDDPFQTIEFLGTSFEEQILNSETTIGDMRKKISEGYNVPVKRVEISYNGKLLQGDHRSFTYYRIPASAYVDVNIKSIED